MNPNTIMRSTRRLLDSLKQFIKSLWNYRRNLKLELFFFFYTMPTFCFAVSFGNFGFEKACRVNLHYNETVCDSVLVWAKYVLHCERIDFENLTEHGLATYEAFREGCFMWRDVLKTDLIAATISFLTVLFAGSWADRHNKRKLFMILPIIGELISYACFLISAIFFDAIPMEFPFNLETYIKSFFGGFITVIMAIFSYITITTPERDRFLRFGIFFMFYSTIVLLGLPISRLLFTYCGYIASFSIALISQIIAILCVVLVVEDIDSETKKKAASNQVTPLTSYDSPPLTGSGAENLKQQETLTSPTNNNENVEMTEENCPVDGKHESSKNNTRPGKRNICLEIFDPTLIRDFVMFPIKKRNSNRRLLLILLICAYFFEIAPTQVENGYWYHYTAVKGGVNDKDSIFEFTSASGVALFGTFIGTAIFSKAIGLSDSLIGMISAVCIVASKFLNAFLEDSRFDYIAIVIAPFHTLNVIAIKTIGSSIVAADEISKFMAILEISYPFLLLEVEKRFGSFFLRIRLLLIAILDVPNVIAFSVCFVVFRQNKAENKKIKRMVKPLRLRSKTPGSGQD